MSYRSAAFAAGLLGALLASGCAGQRTAAVRNPAAASIAATAEENVRERNADHPDVQPASYQAEKPAAKKKSQKKKEARETPPLQPGVGKRFINPPPIPKTPPSLRAIESGQTGSTGTPLTLAQLESLACQHNPTLVQAKAQVDGVFGKAIQAGLWPNPIVGYSQEQISVEDTPGEFVGGFIRQEIVTADKRDLSRAKFLERTRTAQWLAMAQEYRILNDVRMHFFRTLGRQELVGIHQQLLKNAEDSLVTTRELYNLGQVPRSAVHQANVSLQQARLKLLMTQNDYRTAFETLSALTGLDLQVSPLHGALQEDMKAIEWDAALTRLLEESPEIQAAHAKLRADRITLKREKVEPIPNINVQGSYGRNFVEKQNVGNLSVFLEVPLYDWNQGTVKQAEADLVRQRNEIRRTELRLRRELASVYRRFLTAWQHVTNYQSVILPESRKAYETLLDSYEQDRVQWPTVLNAERDYFLHREEYVRNLIAWRENEVLISGYLLHGGLDAPMSVTPPSHIDAVPQPR